MTNVDGNVTSVSTGLSKFAVENMISMENHELYSAVKRCYEKPLVEVTRLEHRAQLLNASGKGTLQDYTKQDYFEE